MPAFSLQYSPHSLTLVLQSVFVAPLPIAKRNPKTSVYGLAPVHYRRTTTRPVSYYALFKCVAASKPTSWLFVQLHILSHLTVT